MFDERIALGLPSLAGYGLPEALETAARLGFRAIMSLPGGPNSRHSLGPFPTLGYSRAHPADIEPVRDALRRFGHISIHQAWNTEWPDWIDCAARVGAETLTVHAGFCGRLASEAGTACDATGWLRHIADHAQARGICLGVENEGGRTEDYLTLIEGAAHPNVGATLDVGHCASFDEVRTVDDPMLRAERLNDTIADVVHELGPKLGLLHVHNVRATDWRDHRSVPDGVVDYPRLFAALTSIGYSGGFDIELEEPERERKAAETGQYLTRLCAELPAAPS